MKTLTDGELSGALKRAIDKDIANEFVTCLIRGKIPDSSMYSGSIVGVVIAFFMRHRPKWTSEDIANMFREEHEDDPGTKEADVIRTIFSGMINPNHNKKEG